MIQVPKHGYQWPSKRLYQVRRAARLASGLIRPDRMFVLEVATLLPAKDPAYCSTRLRFCDLGDLRRKVRSLRILGATRMP